MKVMEAFQVLAQLGDNPEFLEKELKRHDPLYEELLQKAGIRPGSRVLELGCGTGAVSIKLARRMGPEGRVLSIDVNNRMLVTANKKKEKMGLRNLEFENMNMEELDLPEGAFDFVISSFGVCCCFSYDRTLREAYRVLTSGGRLTFNQDGPNGMDKGQLIEGVVGKYEPGNPSRRLKEKRQANLVHERLTRRYQDPFKVLALMRKVGFRNAESSIKYFGMVFRTVDEYLDYYFFDSLTYAELTKERQLEWRKECSAILESATTAGGVLNVDEEVAYFFGQK